MDNYCKIKEFEIEELLNDTSVISRRHHLIGWLVAMVEGEGHLSTGDSDIVKPRIGFKNTNFDLILKYTKILDMFYIQYTIQDIKPEGNNKAKQEVVIGQMSQILRFLRFFKSYFFGKRKQAELLYKFVKGREESTFGKPLTDEERDIVEELTELNGRGLK